MHALLDVTEMLVMESMSAEDSEKFIDSLYMPEVTETPKNFEVEDQMDAFAAFEQATGAFK